MKVEFRRKRMELLAKTAKLIFACSNIHKSTAGEVLTLSPAKLRQENYFPVPFRTNESCSLSSFLEVQFMRNKPATANEIQQRSYINTHLYTFT